MLWITGADQSTVLRAAWSSKRSKFKWRLLFNECHLMIKGGFIAVIKVGVHHV